MIISQDAARKLYLNAHGAYIRTDLENSSPVDLIVKLYEGAIKYVSAAVKEVHKNKHKKIDNIRKGIAIIDELLSCLNIAEGGDLASNLQNLYLYMLIELTKANAADDVNALSHILGMLINLKDGWVQIKEGDFKTNEARIQGVRV